MGLTSGQDPPEGSSHHCIREFYGRVAEATIEYRFDPSTGDADPARYVTYQAFLSLIMDGGFWVPTTRAVLYVMSCTFKESHEKEASDIRDA